LSDAKSAQSVPFDPLLLSPHTASYLTGGDFSRESLARTLLDKTPIFTANLGYEEWIKDVLSKIPMEWPTETKLSIIKAKLDVPFQARHLGTLWSGSCLLAKIFLHHEKDHLLITKR